MLALPVLRLGLLNAHAGDGPRDDQPLDLGRALEDRVDIGVDVPLYWSVALFLNYGPTNSGAHPVSPHQRSITPRRFQPVSATP